jgi:hypothetical protein
MTKLRLVKTLHTVVWVLVVCVIMSWLTAP